MTEYILHARPRAGHFSHSTIMRAHGGGPHFKSRETPERAVTCSGHRVTAWGEGLTSPTPKPELSAPCQVLLEGACVGVGGSDRPVAEGGGAGDPRAA